MAKAYRPPEGYDFKHGPDWSNWKKEAETYTARLRKWCKKNSPSDSPLIGETIQTPMGDGYAVYMVFNTRPLELLHLETFDAWHADPCWLRGLRVADVKQMVEREREIAKLFGGGRKAA